MSPRETSTQVARILLVLRVRLQPEESGLACLVRVVRQHLSRRWNHTPDLHDRLFPSDPGNTHGVVLQDLRRLAHTRQLSNLGSVHRNIFGKSALGKRTRCFSRAVYRLAGALAGVLFSYARPKRRDRLPHLDQQHEFVYDRPEALISIRPTSPYGKRRQALPSLLVMGLSAQVGRFPGKQVLDAIASNSSCCRDPVRRPRMGCDRSLVLSWLGGVPLRPME